ncbi:hypothetical protein [Fodinicola acaciae]|uniref:hypothetical protein n=1 Tax=Fodinicola acaciae TaxID=2681555 RepID=UPI0013D20E78|nr:hypothetical protein [Fodinicola acaciae]
MRSGRPATGAAADEQCTGACRSTISISIGLAVSFADSPCDVGAEQETQCWQEHQPKHWPWLRLDSFQRFVQQWRAARQFDIRSDRDLP